MSGIFWEDEKPSKKKSTEESKQYKAIDLKGAEVGLRETYNAIKDTYKAGKDIHDFFSGKQKYLSRPRNYDEVLQRAAKIKQMERDAKKYEAAKREIEDWEERKTEYESNKPRRSGFGKFHFR